MSLWGRFMKMNLPNKLTLARMAAVPVFMIFVLIDNVWMQYAALLVFIAAAITDYWDGKLARERNLVTNFGKIMDPLADKLLMMAAFISFVQMGYAPAWMVILIISREFAITGLRVLAAAEGTVIAASASGKHKTVSQIVAVILILVVSSVVVSLQTWLPPWEETLRALGMTGTVLIALAEYAPVTAMGIVAVLSLYSGVEYLIKNRELFQESKS